MYTGHPVLFIRTSGCTRNCDFCDTQYHKNGKEMSVKQITEVIEKSEMDIIVWTGGEPMIWENEIYKIIYKTRLKDHHIETNGDILPQKPNLFDYIGFSPKEKRVQSNVLAYVMQPGSGSTNWDIKIVTDLKLNKEMIPNATILMPLSTYTNKDKQIQKDVWEYCVKNKIKYAQRIHVDVWGKTIGK